jgi:hypothetical protein
VNPSALIANSLWIGTNLPAFVRFSRALDHPEEAQDRILKNCLNRGGRTAFGLARDLQSVHAYGQFAERVPVTNYEALEPWIERIRRGESNVLTNEPVTRLIPTSGSTGARKLIPFTAGLQKEFNAAIGPWLVDLARQSPGIIGGPAYWSISPVMADTRCEDSRVPIGFDADTAYLGGTRQRLANAVMAVPDQLRFVHDIEVYRYLSLLCLLRQRELRLISVWHPSFLSLLLNALPGNWPDLLADIRRGQCKHETALPRLVRSALKWPPLPHREAELRAADPEKPETLWPHLKLISCWSDSAAGIAASSLKQRFPNTLLQPKGLLSTEAFLTIPFAGFHPVALCSHFFEFMDEAGKVRRLEDLRLNHVYEVVVTTSGGLWRYRTNDSVRVNGFVGRTPSLRFLGRRDNVSDLCGEKLAEGFVTRVIRDLFASFNTFPTFVMLAPGHDGPGQRYTVYLEGKPPPNLAETLDQALRRNPHYAYCRDLGQLQPIELFIIAGRAYETYANRQMALGMRLGEIKPALFSPLSGWSNIFVRAQEPVRD